ncbi:hypothetical protein JLT2_33 [Paraglaciecola Antarctic JLT virus 2]|nr:hypothetical protein JLT2_33 [Paraglaciecola Antarctic JLT virus 2]
MSKFNIFITCIICANVALAIHSLNLPATIGWLAALYFYIVKANEK